MLKGLKEARRQILISYPVTDNLTKAERIVVMLNWAEQTYAKLARLGPIQEQKTTLKPATIGVKSLTEDEMDALTRTIISCTDLKQLKKLRDVFFVHLRGLTQRFRRWR